MFERVDRPGVGAAKNVLGRLLAPSATILAYVQSSLVPPVRGYIGYIPEGITWSHPRGVIVGASPAVYLGYFPAGTSWVFSSEDFVGTSPGK